MPKTYTTKDGDTIDAIAFEHYGRHQGTTEAILEANRGLAEHPLMLPAELTITLPDLAPDAATQSVKPVMLYD